MSKTISGKDNFKPVDWPVSNLWRKYYADSSRDQLDNLQGFYSCTVIV